MLAYCLVIQPVKFNAGLYSLPGVSKTRFFAYLCIPLIKELIENVL